MPPATRSFRTTSPRRWPLRPTPPSTCSSINTWASGQWGASSTASRHMVRALAKSPCACCAAHRPPTIPVSEFDANLPLFDARQLRRWGLDPSRLPPGAIVRWREPSLWPDYKGTVLSVSGSGAVLLGLVVGLLYERRARRRANLRRREQLTITAHLGRQLALGEMATALAHELNQPLGTIRLCVAAAERMLSSGRGSPPRAQRDSARHRPRGRPRQPDHSAAARHAAEARSLNGAVSTSTASCVRASASVAHEAESRRVVSTSSCLTRPVT